MRNTHFESAIASMEEIQSGNPNNPLLTVIKFIFSDNLGNKNNQGVDEEEFDTISESAINMPVKMRLVEKDVGNHELSIPIGHITGMEKLVDGDVVKLVASAVLYKAEFPEEVNFLKEKFASGEAPGISWELAYKDSIIKDGVEWLKKVITSAATFVKSPAYGSRTALLAIASSAAASSDGEAMEKLEEIINLWRKESPKGGKSMDELEKAKSDLAAAQAEVTRLTAELATANSTIATKDEDITAKAAEIEGFKKAEVISKRVAKVVEAGMVLETDDDKLTERKEFLYELSEKAFEKYVADITEAKKETKPASASNKGGLPRPSLTGQDLTSLDDLKLGLRKASRGEE